MVLSRIVVIARQRIFRGDSRSHPLPDRHLCPAHGGGLISTARGCCRSPGQNHPGSGSGRYPRSAPGVIVAGLCGHRLWSTKKSKKRTVLVLIAKPVSRAEFLIGKHLGLSPGAGGADCGPGGDFSGGGGLQWYSVSAAERTALHRLHVLRGRATDGGSHCLRSLYQFSAGPLCSPSPPI